MKIFIVDDEIEIEKISSIFSRMRDYQVEDLRIVNHIS